MSCFFCCKKEELCMAIVLSIEDKYEFCNGNCLDDMQEAIITHKKNKELFFIDDLIYQQSFESQDNQNNQSNLQELISQRRIILRQIIDEVRDIK